MTRQKKLVDAIGGRIADTWFSIHCPDIEEAVYVSEVVEKTMNPSYRFFDLNSYGPKVTRRDDLTLKLWVNTERGQDHIQLIDLQVHLGSLQFIGKSLESFHHPLPQNCIIFHLSDGIYTSFTDLPLDNYAPPSAGLPPKSPSITPQSTSSFDALMRLSNLDDCIQDALATREQITSQISSFLEDHQSSRTKIASVSTSQESLASTRRAVSATRRMLSTVQRRRADLDASIKARRAAIESGHISQKQSQSYLSSAEETLSSKTTLSKSTIDTLNGQIRRICEDLSAIYPIEPVEGKPLSFTIRGLYLPNANFFSTTNNASETTTAAALGMVAHILDLLSYYLSTPLPYPVTANGSTSSVYDPISVSLTHTSSTNASAPSSNSASNVAARTFPLFQTTSIQYRFEYGVFLLNTNLELLMWKRGLRMVDQRQTLANLKYLLVVCGSGRGEVPGRKRGVVGALSSAGGDEASRSEREDEEEEGSGNGGKKVWKGKGKEVVGNGGLR
ncbi:hypothetical protein MMC14_010545 [Varicellaria rhodocarpa]|nr:hypothetical protein [Varicellaria rhodocarpa]